MTGRRVDRGEPVDALAASSLTGWNLAPLPGQRDSRLAHGNGLRGGAARTPARYVNKPWPAAFSPTTVDLPPVPFGPFPASLRLTEAGDVTLVPVPGHSPGQLAVVVEDVDYSLAGDSSYTQDAMLRRAVDGVGADEDAERRTHERIRAYMATTPTVHLPSHDPETAVRLAERRPVGAVRDRAVA